MFTSASHIDDLTTTPYTGDNSIV